jgi:hypothetical protein
MVEGITSLRRAGSAGNVCDHLRTVGVKRSVVAVDVNAEISETPQLSLSLEWYYAFDTWPDAVRTELKKAVKAKNRGDAVRSEAAFRK